MALMVVAFLAAWLLLVFTSSSLLSPALLLTPSLQEADETTRESRIRHGIIVDSSSSRNVSPDQPDLPPIVQLSPGTFKYVLVKAQKTTSLPKQQTTLWFVKSASPQECGGPYHRFVAKDLVQRLKSLGWHTVVTGGGRIQYDVVQRHAVVYGYSNRYGKGDHVLAAQLIAQHTDIKAVYDLSDGLY